MSHPTKLTLTILSTAAGLLLTGCGESNSEKLAKEKEQQRLDAEKQAMKDLQKSNQAVSDVSKKIGRKVEPIDLGLPAEKKTEAAPAAPPK